MRESRRNLLTVSIVSEEYRSRGELPTRFSQRTERSLRLIFTLIEKDDFVDDLRGILRECR